MHGQLCISLVCQLGTLFQVDTCTDALSLMHWFGLSG